MQQSAGNARAAGKYGRLGWLTIELLDTLKRSAPLACHNALIVTGVLTQGCLLLAGLSLAWIWATLSRQRALADLVRQRRFARAEPGARAPDVRAPASP